MTDEEQQPVFRMPLREGKRMAVGIISAWERRDKEGIRTLLDAWDDESTMALAALTLMLLRHYMGEDGARAFLTDTALEISEE